MSVLEGFTVFNFDEGVPYMSVTKNGITFNKGVVMKLGYPSYIQLLINQDTQQLAIRACSENDKYSFPFFKGEKKSKVLSVRINVKDLLNRLVEIMQWDLETYNYRIDGTLIPEENAMIFELNNCRVIS